MFGPYDLMRANQDHTAETDGIVVATVYINDEGPRVTIEGSVGGQRVASVTAHYWPREEGLCGRIRTNSMTFPVGQGKSWRVDEDHEFMGDYNVEVFWVSH